MISIAVLAGGNSDEREVSLRSGAAVASALEAKGYSIVTLDPADGINILLDQLKQADVVFPALHGKGGEDGVVQAVLEQHHIPFVGSSSVASAICFDKHRFEVALSEQTFDELHLPASQLVDHAAFQASNLSKQPFVLKPNDGGSSIDTFIIRDPEAADLAAIQAAFERHQTMLLQALISGTEITVAVLENEALPVIEIIPPADKEFDYENKYNGATQELCPPQNVNLHTQKKAQKLALQIHRAVGCRDMSRTDMIITESQELFVLEINTIPGLTNQSLLPKAAAAAGYDMPTMIDRLVRAAYAPR